MKDQTYAVSENCFVDLSMPEIRALSDCRGLPILADSKSDCIIRLYCKVEAVSCCCAIFQTAEVDWQYDLPLSPTAYTEHWV